MHTATAASVNDVKGGTRHESPVPPLATHARRPRPKRVVLDFADLVQRIADRFGNDVAVRWTKAVLAHQGKINEAALRRAIASGNVKRIEKVLGPEMLQRAIEKGTTQSILRAAREAGKESSKILTAAGVTAPFNVMHPNVVKFARERSAELVVGVPKEVKQIISEVIARGAESGLTVAEQARAIREVVGLPPNWINAPSALEKALRSGNVDLATSRRLSAKTKQQIRSRIKNGTVTPAFIRQVLAEYRASLIHARALTIARTETSRAANFGLHESWQQAQADGTLPDTARRFWLVTPDDRLSPEHATIPFMNRRGRRIDEPFKTTEGEHMYPPSRPNCRCSVGLAFTGGEVVIEGGPNVGEEEAAKKKRPKKKPKPAPKAEPKQGASRTAEARALDKLANTPGLTAEQAGAIGFKDGRPHEELLLPQGVQPARRVQGALSPEEQWLKALGGEYPEDIFRKLANAPPTTSVKIADLVAGQSSVTRAGVEAYIKSLSAGKVPSTLPTVVRYKGVLYLKDGNHRATAYWLIGRHSMQAQVIDLDAALAARAALPTGADAAEQLEAMQAAVKAALTRPSNVPEWLDPTTRKMIEEAVEKVGVSTDGIRYTNKREYVSSGGSLGLKLGEYKDGILEILVHPQVALNKIIETAAHEATHLKFDLASHADLDLYTFIGKHFKQLMADDGVSAYSRAHWKHAIKLLDGNILSQASIPAQLQASLAVEETLTEMAAAATRGMDTGSALYRQLQALVDRKYAKALRAGIAPREARRLARIARDLGPAEGAAAQKVVKAGAVKYTAKEIKAVKEYAALPGSINKALRGRQGASAIVREIDKAIRRSGPLGRDIVVWRGLQTLLMSSGRTVKVFKDLGFVSTTTARKIAEEFGTSTLHGVNLVRITVPKGTRALWAHTLSNRFADEKEVLLPRGLTFRVVRKRTMTVQQYEAEFGKLSMQSRTNPISTITVTDVEIVPAP